MSSIPAQVWAHILPCPTLSVTHFLRFPFPSQLPKSSTKQDLRTFWSSKKPNVLEFTAETLKDLPIPSAAVLSALISTAHTFNHESSSIVYAHLPNQLHFYYPPWFLDYWITVSSLREHVKVPWMQAELFLSANGAKWHSSEFRRLCQSAQNALLCLPWCGNVHGFADNAPTVTLASYLSRNWLSTTHINQQLDLLRQELSRVGNQEYEILGPDFFTKVRWLYRDRAGNPYPASGNRLIREVGHDLAKGTRKIICGVANINENHWVGIVVDGTECKIKFGNSLGGSGAELKAAIRWWIQIHTSLDFEDANLDITRQSDAFNCGLFALNAVEHFTHPNTKPLLHYSASPAPYNEDRLSRFLKICNQDLEMVCLPSRLCLF